MAAQETSVQQQATTLVRKLVSYFIHEKTSTAAHVLVFFIFALLLGYRYLFHNLVLHPGHDALLYQELAGRIWAGQGWWLPSGAPFPPLYPTWLGLFTAVLVPQNWGLPLALYISHITAVGGCMAIARKIFTSSALAWLWLCVLPVQIVYQFSWSETLSLPLVHLLLLYGIEQRDKRSLSPGISVLWALLPLIRWANLYWVAASMVHFFWTSERKKPNSWKDWLVPVLSLVPLMLVWVVNHLNFQSIWGIHRINISTPDTSALDWLVAVADGLGYVYRWTATDSSAQSIQSILLGSSLNVLALLLLTAMSIRFMKANKQILYMGVGYLVFLLLASQITFIDVPDFRLLSPVTVALFVGLLGTARDHRPHV